MRTKRFRLLVGTCGIAVFMGGVVAMPARAASDLAVRYGVVDLGDRVAFHQAPTDCATPVTIEVTTPGGTVESAPSVGCSGAVTVPDIAAVEATGWHDDGPIDIELVSGSTRVPLRYMRLQAEAGASASGAPQVVGDAHDPRGGGGAAVLAVGDVIDLGTVDLRGIRSIAMRTSAAAGVCDTAGLGSCAPSRFELRADRVNGPAVAFGDVGPVTSVAAYNAGWSDSWVTTTWKLVGDLAPGTTRLFLAVTAAPAPVSINWVDLNGSGIRLPREVVDPVGTRVLFDGTSFDGWNNRGFTLRDGAMRAESNLSATDPSWLQTVTAEFGRFPYNVLNAGGSVISSVDRFKDVSIRLQFRLEQFEDNGSIILGPVELQMTDASEWYTGGIVAGPTCQPPYPPGAPVSQLTGTLSGEPAYCGFPAERIKSGTFPDWAEMEIIQHGGTWVVRIEGREVSRSTTADPEPYPIMLNNSPLFSRRLQLDSSSAIHEHGVSTPDEWGHIWFRNIRVAPCTATTCAT